MLNLTEIFVGSETRPEKMLSSIDDIGFCACCWFCFESTIDVMCFGVENHVSVKLCEKGPSVTTSCMDCIIY